MAIRATVTFVKAYADVSYISPSAMDFKILAESEYKFYYEILTLSEAVIVVLNKNLSDSFSTLDVSILNMTKPIFDSFAFADNFARTVTYNRSFSDAFTLDDISQIDKHIGSNKGNIATLSDVLGYGLTKPLTDTTTLSEVLVALVSKTFTDSFGFSDSQTFESGKILSDSYSFSDGQNYHLGKGSNDSFSYTDTQTFHHNRILADAFTLDDAAMVDKDYYGNKGNIFSFADTISISRIHGRALGNMVLGSKQFN